MPEFPLVRTAEKVDRAIFENEIKPFGQPVVLKGLVADWPCVRAARESPEALGAYIKRHDVGKPVALSVCPKQFQGRFFYNDDLTGMNFTTIEKRLNFMVDWCLTEKPGEPRDAVYVQGQEIDALLPAMANDMPMPLLDATVRPRVWIANTVRTQTHFDLSSNIACHVSGEKVFTLFPPDQLANLYPGPLELTPAGVPVSMVELEAPDFERFPRFHQALAVAQQAKLEPGDALYMPPMWWHHVQTTGPLNMLVNYWWSDVRKELPPPFLAFYMTVMGFRHMPPAEREAWQGMLDYFVFEQADEALAHLPEKAQGVFRKDINAAELLTYQRQLKQLVGS
jgi:hypothetical protein